MEAWLVLFEKYRTLPRRMAVKYKQKLPACVDVDDLEQCGLIGLMEAAKRFDPTRNVRFSTFAGSRIFGAMVDGIRDMDWGPRLLRKQKKEAVGMVSLQTVWGEDYRGSRDLLDFIDSSVPQPGAALEDAESYANLVACLPWRWRGIVRDYYGGEFTCRELSESLGLTESRIFQILAECRRRLRRKLETARA